MLYRMFRSRGGQRSHRDLQWIVCQMSKCKEVESRRWDTVIFVVPHAGQSLERSKSVSGLMYTRNGLKWKTSLDWLEFLIWIVRDGPAAVALVVVGPGSCTQLRIDPLRNDVRSLFPHSFNVVVQTYEPYEPVGMVFGWYLTLNTTMICLNAC